MTAADPDFIEAAYAEVMRRAVDPKGLADALAALDSGQPRDQWLVALRCSGEARQAASGATTAQATACVDALLAVGPDRVFVRRALRAVLGRDGLEPEVQAACRQLARGASRSEWLRELRHSPIGRIHRTSLVDVHKLDLRGDELTAAASPDLARLQAVSDEAFIFLAYRSVLGRTPDDQGRANYLRRARAGEPRLRLLQEMASSPEGRARAAAIEPPAWIAQLAATPPHRRVLRLLRRAVSVLRRAWGAATTINAQREAP